MLSTRNIQQTFIENTLHKHRLEKNPQNTSCFGFKYSVKVRCMKNHCWLIILKIILKITCIIINCKLNLFSSWWIPKNFFMNHIYQQFFKMLEILICYFKLYRHIKIDHNHFDKIAAFITLKKIWYNPIKEVPTAVVQWVRAFVPQAEWWVFHYHPRQTLVVKTGSDRSTAKRSAIGVSVTGPRRWPLLKVERATVGVA